MSDENQTSQKLNDALKRVASTREKIRLEIVEPMFDRVNNRLNSRARLLDRIKIQAPAPKQEEPKESKRPFDVIAEEISKLDAEDLDSLTSTLIERKKRKERGEKLDFSARVG